MHENYRSHFVNGCFAECVLPENIYTLLTPGFLACTPIPLGILGVGMDIFWKYSLHLSTIRAMH